MLKGLASSTSIPGHFPAVADAEELKSLAVISNSSGVVPPVSSDSANQTTPIQSPNQTGRPEYKTPSFIARITKRLVAVSFPTAYGTFSCSTEPSTKRPFQDCINLIAAYCQTTSPLFSTWSNCQSRVLSVRDVLNSNWKDYITSCAKFAGGNPASSACNAATTRILTLEYYFWYDDSNKQQQTLIPRSVVDTAAYIWNT